MLMTFHHTQSLVAGNTHSYTLQCALPLNLWNEKIYMFLWFWMFAVAALNCIGFLNWLLAFIVPNDRVRFVQNHLRAYQRLRSARDKELSRVFARDYLKQDGAFLLRLIAHNTNTVSTTEITCQLWDKWLKRYNNSHKDVDDDDDDDDEKAALTNHDDSNKQK